MAVELPKDLAEEIADELSIYDIAEEHEEDCNCRVCFVIGLTKRIRDSRDSELVLSGRKII